ncbi:MAG: MFS transporter [Bacteroidota bacterium]|nr:MFS transporter [Bacteroidota bacterium]
MTATAAATRIRTAHDRVLHGWYMYDWANSAFAVTILAALFGPYLDKVVVPDAGFDIPLLGVTALSATSLYGYALGISALLVLLSSPILGAIADSTSAKKSFLMFFCYLGSSASLLMFFVGEGDVTMALLLFMVANFSFVSANVFYDAFLPHIAAPEMQDVVSGKGYAYGYAGGGLLFTLQLLLVQFHELIGISEVMAVRMSLGSVGLWWGGFSMITFSRLTEPRLTRPREHVATLVADGFRRIRLTFSKVRSLRQLGTFLLAFMIYNDGIQTVIAMATIYGSEELGFDTLTLMGALLMIQFVGVVGAQLFGMLARRFGSKNMVIVALMIWTGVIVYAYFMTEPMEFWILGAVVGLVLGGSQALSRSMYSRIIPPAASAEFFGFFSVFEKFSAIWGPIAFALIRQLTGSARLSILSLVVFFFVGMIVLIFVRMDKAEEERDRLERSLGNLPEALP